MIPSPNNLTQKQKVPYHFGEKIRKVREEKGYTLKVVAQKAGVSESLVSQIERNHVSPAIDTLLNLADVLDINLEYLFEEYRRARPVSIIRANERPVIDEDGVIYEELAAPENQNQNNSIETYILKIPVGTHTHHGSYGHVGREVGIITKGTVKLTYENVDYILSEGDSVSFSAGVPHFLENIGSTDFEAIWIVTPSQRFATKHQ